MTKSNSVSMRFRRIEKANELIELIEIEAQKLQQRHPQIHRIDVVIDKREQKHSRGNPIRAQVTLRLPGKLIVADKRSVDQDELGGASVALLQAFAAAEHAVAAYLNRRRPTRHAGHFWARPAMLRAG